MSFILDHLFGSTLRSVDPFDTTSDGDICVAISNANGHQQSLFVPEQCFHALVKRQIARLERPALETVEAVRSEMTRMAVRATLHTRFLCIAVRDALVCMAVRGAQAQRADPNATHLPSSTRAKHVPPFTPPFLGLGPYLFSLNRCTAPTCLR